MESYTSKNVTRSSALYKCEGGVRCAGRNHLTLIEGMESTGSIDHYWVECTIHIGDPNPRFNAKPWRSYNIRLRGGGRRRYTYEGKIMTIFALLSAGGVDQNAANPDLGVGEIFTIRMNNIHERDRANADL